MHYIYILLLKNNNLYTGTTNDLKRRYNEHKKGKIISTKNKRPLRLIHYEVYLLKSDALRREKFLKTTEGKRLLRQQIKNCFAKLMVRPIIRPQSYDGVVLSNDGTIGRPVG